MKRVLSVFLVCAFLLALLPTSALAAAVEDTTQESLGQSVPKLDEVQAMIDALSDAEGITPDNRAEVEAQLAAIDEARAGLTDEETEQLNFSRYQAIVSALAALDGQAGASTPQLAEITDNYLVLSWNEATNQVTSTSTPIPATAIKIPNDYFSSNSTTLNTGTYCVTGDNVVASGRITISGEVHLILMDGCKLKAQKGIGVSTGNKLSIYAQSKGEQMGQLNAAGPPAGEFGAAIGGGLDVSCGEIIIHGGAVSAKSNDDWSAGIGGSLRSGGGTITIYDGNVTAGSRLRGAGIGGGSDGGDGSVNIYGGYVTAKGGQWASNDIGAGVNSSDKGSFNLKGNAVVIVTDLGISDDDNPEEWNGIIFKGNEGTVYGDVTLTSDFTISSKQTLTIPAGSSLTMANGATLYNNGIIKGEGDLTGSVSGNTPDLPAAPTITTPPQHQSVIYGEQVTFSVVASGKPAPAYQWQVSKNNGSSWADVTDGSGGTAASYTTPNADMNMNGWQYHCVVSNTKGNAISDAATLTVNKLTPTPDTPTGLTATYGQTLANVTLPTGWAWDDTATSVGNVGDNNFSATFTPADTTNYNTVTKNLTVRVSPASRTIKVTGGQANSPTQITLKEAEITPSGTGGTVRYGKNTANTAPSTWQTGRVFSGLTADTTYYFFAKVEADGNYAEAISKGVPISTPAKAVSSITIASQPTKLSYTSGQSLDLSGLSVTVTYNDNTTGKIEWSDNKLTAVPDAGTVLTVTKHNGKTVSISYVGQTATTDALTVTQGTQAAASITGAPATIYNGDSFTLTLSGGSGAGAVTWEIVSGTATVDANGKVTVNGTGEIQIKAVKAADTDYTQAEATITLNAVARPSQPTGGGGGYTPPSKPSVSVDGGGGKVEAGSSGTVTITPDEGYQIEKVTVNGKEVDIPADGRLTGLKPSDKVVVTFTEVPVAPIVTVEQFVDVAPGAWYYDAVKYAVDHGLFYGTSDTTFSPNSTMTRGMLATVLYRMTNEPEADPADFLDVGSGQYYSEAVAWAAANGIVAGYGNGNFGPEDAITREQLATILWRYSGSPAPAGTFAGFTDADKASSYALEALRWAVEQGIIQGKGGGILDPAGKATRAEVAAMLQRFCEKAGR